MPRLPIGGSLLKAQLHSSLGRPQARRPDESFPRRPSLLRALAVSLARAALLATDDGPSLWVLQIQKRRQARKARGLCPRA